MRSLSKPTRYSFFIISLLLLIILTGLSLPVKSSVLQTAPSPTPTPTIIYVNGEPVLESGDTEGLILGAGIILLIILTGVIIQRVIQRKNSPGSY